MPDFFLKKICKGDENPEDKEHSGQPSEGDNSNQEDHWNFSS